ncbi:Sucrose phosphorylase [Sebaldella termitidis]|uniref:Alpha amylase catalytic region n=1 Tax=Sebaldella termitidis (strain ATCC 33386 / NCTC 11300) TaxID=526218 RepID=D1AHZ8_SEBTE|nr:sugar phosphorylase [Sebaldella termitidis]ACZ08382.1 alpha amylase catalytic region [Sebaldella termitidis ATCC 33386]SUI23695.1 Sucrose phosphorylase [Sebaldella termitidis]
MAAIRERLIKVYGEETAGKYTEIIETMINNAQKKQKEQKKVKWDEKDVVLITYGDQIYKTGEKTLKTFDDFSEKYFKNVFELVHFLPFFPYSSDDGFSVIDYKKIHENMGDWADIEKIRKNFRLMFDFVCNHISAKSEWFQEYLKCNPEYDNFFIAIDKNTDLSLVTRPRTLPLLSEFDTACGKKYIWTTFSDDQIDLNFENPEVLIKMLDVLLFYLEKGADWIRLDAVGFMWKEAGTTCIHHEKTHEIIKLFRDAAEQTAPGTVIITETNVPHKDNISYFGNGRDEAQMVYQFPLPPLVIYTFMHGDSSAISRWASNLEVPGDEVTYFNFLASHDGIGINPVRGIIEEEEILEMVRNLEKEGALVSYKKNTDGTLSPYEINSSYINAVSRKNDTDEMKTGKFLNAQAVLLAFKGVPAIYVHSILGSENYYEGVKITGMNRTINREKLEYGKITSELENKNGIRSRIYNRLKELIKARKTEKSFNPDAEQIIQNFGSEVFSFIRISVDKEEKILIINNISDKEITLKIPYEIKRTVIAENSLTDENHIRLASYGFTWLEIK